ncbi:Photosystem II reaction center W protein, chloroplastic [Ananas comosus]|uniref:PSII 6.1 kDa protein n=1 Tax=Ananas comosus TaxID=4615 RepID=A0A199UYS6_ANACO|nr:Photosystem II reaction center W protein, chloroplastic [Ananas comosus]
MRDFVIGLPQIRMRGGRVKCSARDEKARVGTEGGAAALAAAAAGVAVTAAGPALALVDERLTTEGTGLSLGISNNLLGWILLGVFGVIWALYFVYTSTLEEDEESGGLSL